MSALRHDAFFYESDGGFADRFAPFFADGLAEGDALVAVTTRANAEILREALGPDGERATFVDRDAWYTRPIDSLASYHRTVRRLVRAGAPRVRAIGEVAFGTTPREWDEWTAYEAIVNRSLAAAPAWVICPYDARVLPDVVLAQAAHTHAGGDDEATVRALAPPAAPLPRLRDVPVGEGGRAFREDLARELRAERVADAEARDLVLAAGELLANALRHGGGMPAVRVGCVDGSVVCELSDRGPGLDDPFAGYVPPDADGGGGGLWVARQLVRRLELLPTSEGGLTARLWL
jgi:anti-sigma regulatory factor (Ser/Thr protein kinase)